MEIKTNVDRKMCKLLQEIEKLPASEQQTKVVILAGDVWKLVQQEMEAQRMSAGIENSKVF